MQKDTLLPFLFENLPIKGSLVLIEESWKKVLISHQYPAPVNKILGELLTCSILLANSLKFEGTFTIQIQGTGPIRMLIAECNEKLEIRATATIDKTFDFTSETQLLNLIGEGTLAITLNPKDGKQAYQSLVPIISNEISSIFESYLLKSEQILSKFKLLCSENSIGGILLQKIPTEEKPEDFRKSWSHLGLILDNMEFSELQNDNNNILSNLAGDEEIRVFNDKKLKFSCKCSRDKIAQILLTLGKREADDIVAKEGLIKVICEFCGQSQEFDSIDIGALFSGSLPEDPIH